MPTRRNGPGQGRKPTLLFIGALLVTQVMLLSGCTEELQESASIVPQREGSSATYKMEGLLAGVGQGFGVSLTTPDGQRLFPTTGTLHVTMSHAKQTFFPTGEATQGYTIEYRFTGDREYYLGAQTVSPSRGVINSISDAIQRTEEGDHEVWVHGWNNGGPDSLFSLNTTGKTWHPGTMHAVSNGNVREFTVETPDGYLLVKDFHADGDARFSILWDPDCPWPSTFVHQGSNTRILLALQRTSCDPGDGKILVGADPEPIQRPIRSKQSDITRPWWSSRFDVDAFPLEDAWGATRDSLSYITTCPDDCTLTEFEYTRPSTPLHQWGFVLTDTDETTRKYVAERDARTGLTTVSVVEHEPATVSSEYDVMTDEQIHPALTHFSDRLEPFGIRVSALPSGQTTGTYVAITAGHQDQSEAASPRAHASLAWMAQLDGELSSFPWDTPLI